MLQKPLAERLHLQEVVGLLGLLDLHGRVQRTLTVFGEIALFLELLAALAVGAGVVLLDDQVLVEDRLFHAGDGLLVAFAAGAHEIVVGDVKLVEDVPEFLAQRMSRNSSTGMPRSCSGFLVLLAMFVHAGRQHQLVTQRLAVAFQDIGHDRGEGVTDMRRTVDVVDRGRDVAFHPNAFEFLANAATAGAGSVHAVRICKRKQSGRSYISHSCAQENPGLFKGPGIYWQYGCFRAV